MRVNRADSTVRARRGVSGGMIVLFCCEVP